ncbi:MAG: 4-hydroxyphenylpyruvate dioxygenase [Deltaproteobacteria bacterium]|nr:4-hydroxyphenylpyruvate dioxygenase [Deltaproteobacteria bacterium]
MTTSPTNPCGLRGIAFVEVASADPAALHDLLVGFGFSRTMRHARRAIDLSAQGEMVFLLNREPDGVAGRFRAQHGPSISAMGWRTVDGQQARAIAVTRGARAVDGELERGGIPTPAVAGIGDSLLYLVDDGDTWAALGFVAHDQPVRVPDKGFVAIDHLTNNVYKGTMATWAAFYKDVFGFTEVRYFDIRGVMTGLTSYALRSPCGTFAIPINEADEARSQINEYLDEYHGPGIQHLAFLTRDILASLRALEGAPISFLDIDDEYYATVFDRVPEVVEDRAELRQRNVLIDGDERGYLLQIFTKNLIGPIFVEIIQRAGHDSFGEGNFGALFRSIERDQVKRGYL